MTSRTINSCTLLLGRRITATSLLRGRVHSWCLTVRLSVPS